MAKRPRVGVTGNARRWSPSWWCSKLALNLAGASAERISLRHPVADHKLDALVIGGGDDIHPEHYNGDLREMVKADPERDHLEITFPRVQGYVAELPSESLEVDFSKMTRTGSLSPVVAGAGCRQTGGSIPGDRPGSPGTPSEGTP